MVPLLLQRSLLALLVTSLLITTGLGRVAASSGTISGPGILAPASFVAEEKDEGDDGEESDGGWIDSVIDTGGDIIAGTKDVVVETASDAWDVIDDAPGVVWGVIKSAPGAIGEAVSGAWTWFSANEIELASWRDFLDRYPFLGAILGPLVDLLIGLTPDGTISYLEIGLGLIVLAVPVIKGAQTVLRGTDDVLPWAGKVDDVVNTVRRNPDGVVNGVMDTYRFTRARAIAPVAEDFATLPGSPGVYIALDATGNPLYVGMSNSLVRRVPQHFDKTPAPFAGSTSELKIMPTGSVSEARALECRLIKTFSPEHNTVHNNPNPCPSYLPAVILPMP